MRDECPQCGNDSLWRDSADVGVGTIYGPWRCSHCYMDQETFIDNLTVRNDLEVLKAICERQAKTIERLEKENARMKELLGELPERRARRKA